MKFATILCLVLSTVAPTMAFAGGSDDGVILASGMTVRIRMSDLINKKPSVKIKNGNKVSHYDLAPWFSSRSCDLYVTGPRDADVFLPASFVDAKVKIDPADPRGRGVVFWTYHLDFTAGTGHAELVCTYRGEPLHPVKTSLAVVREHLGKYFEFALAGEDRPRPTGGADDGERGVKAVGAPEAPAAAASDDEGSPIRSAH